MRAAVFRLLQACVLAANAALLAWALISGRISWYIHTRFVPLTVFALVCLTLLAVSLLAERRGAERVGAASAIWELAWLALPAALAVFSPAQPLSAEALQTRMVSFSAPPPISRVIPLAVESDAEQRSILDWLRLFEKRADLAPYLGKEAEVIGFVIRQPRLAEDQFLVGRFVITCCAADALPVALAVKWKDSAGLTEGEWVRVKGSMDVLDINGQRVPLLRADLVERVEAPQQPYLFP